MPTITQLPVATTVGDTDDFVIVQSGVTKQAVGSLLQAFIETDIQITEAQVTGLTADLAAKMVKAANLSDVTNVATARSNLGLGSAALVAVPITAPNGGTGVASPTTGTLPVAQGIANFAFLGPLTNGQLLIGSTGVNPVAANLTAGPGVSISNAAGAITISGTGSGVGWTEVTGTSQAMTADSGYVANNGGLVTLTLPTVAAFGSVINVVGKGAGGWAIAQNASQQVFVGSVGTTIGVGGSIASTNAHDSIQLVCTTANLVWTTLGGVQGVLTIV